VIEVPGYRIVRPLGQGGMGSVFLAEKVSTGEPFAIKFLRRDCMDDPTYLVRFEREVGALRAIRHPNVVNVYGWLIPEGPDSEERPFVIMEYLEGEGLDAVLAREQQLSPLVATRIMLQILDGLATAHQVGVIHRDLGPSNVFLVPRQRGRFHVKILDFGLVRSLDVGGGQSELTQQGTLMGKPAYVAPEVLAGRPVDGRCDIFACGVLLFRMLTGEFPYKESDSHLLWIERLRDARSETEYPPPSTLVPDIPQALDRITSKAMRVRLADRYSTVEAMQEDLLEVETALVGEHPSKADWSSSRPGIMTLGEIPVGGIEQRRHSIPPDATPTVGAVSPPLAPRRRRRLLVLGGAGAGAALFLVLLLVVLLRGGAGPKGTDADAEAGPAVAAVPAGPEDAIGADRVAPPAQVPGSDGGAEAGPAKVVPPDVVEVGAQAAADTPQEAAPERVEVVVRGAPKGAVVHIGTMLLTGDPPSGLVPVSRGAELVVEARGYVTHRENVVLGNDRVVQVRLRRVAREAPRGARDDRPVRAIPSVPDEPF